MVIVVQIWVLLMINIDDLNSALDQTKMNVWLQLGQMKLNRSYVDFLYLVVTRWLLDESLVMNIAH